MNPSNMDANQICSDFIELLKVNMVKLEEMLEKITNINYQVVSKMLEAALLFDPILQLKLEEIEDSLDEAKSSLEKGQDLKADLARTLQPLQPSCSAYDYQKMIEEIANL